jgi:hypothetical protein
MAGTRGARTLCDEADARCSLAEKYESVVNCELLKDLYQAPKACWSW